MLRAMRVSEWQVLLAAPPGQELTFSPSPPGVHAVVSSWLHSSEQDGAGEPHHAEHHYAVAWWRTAADQLCITLKLMDERLVTTLLRRVRPGQSVGFGRVNAIVTQVAETAMTDLAELRGRAASRWQLRFPAGVTFKRGDICMPWPSPEAVLNSIRRRLTQVWGWEPEASAMRDAIRAVAPCRVDLATRSWREGRNGRGREVALAVGEVEWAASGPEETRRLIDLLLQAGELIGVGARTTWGAGALEVSRPGLATPPEGVATR